MRTAKLGLAPFLSRSEGTVFRNAKITVKVVAAIVLTLVVTLTISFWITQRRINRQAEEAFRDKVRQITGMAGATREWLAANIDVLVPDRISSTSSRSRL
jgi:hypothetical protein